MWQLGEDGEQPEWRTVETPFDETLFGVAQTSEGPYAVGTNGYLVGDRGDGWEVIFDDGPSTRDNQMRAMDTTDDGERIWMLGSSARWPVTSARWPVTTWRSARSSTTPTPRR
jgi:hypothetical protein